MNQNTTRSSAPRVALLIDSADAYGRRVLAGVARFLRENDRWSVFGPEECSDDMMPDWFENWRGDGVISQRGNSTALTAIKRLGTPAVSLCDVPPYLNIPMVVTDDTTVGRLAFGHLHERDFKAFAYCDRAGTDAADERQRSFHDCATAASRPCHLFEVAKALPQKSDEDGKYLARWIAELPKPVGIMAGNDQRGREILEACRALKIAVPYEVAVIGVDDDEVLCGLTDPPLSSVATNAEQVGYQAAALLGRLMAGQPAEQRRLLVEPTGVVARHSTDMVATDDREIAAAIKFIREHTGERITVEDVARAARTTRRTLERRYAEILGRSLKQEILRPRLDRAKQLLVETNFSMAVIAGKIGIRHQESFIRTFTKNVGMSPAVFRSLARAGQSET